MRIFNFINNNINQIIHENLNIDILQTIILINQFMKFFENVDNFNFFNRNAKKFVLFKN